MGVPILKATHFFLSLRLRLRKRKEHVEAPNCWIRFWCVDGSRLSRVAKTFSHTLQQLDIQWDSRLFWFSLFYCRNFFVFLQLVSWWRINFSRYFFLFCFSCWTRLLTYEWITIRVVGDSERLSIKSIFFVAANFKLSIRNETKNRKIKTQIFFITFYEWLTLKWLWNWTLT